MAWFERLTSGVIIIVKMAAGIHQYKSCARPSVAIANPERIQPIKTPCAWRE
jgi:hypothetical protein